MAMMTEEFTALRLGQQVIRVAESKTIDRLGEEVSKFIAEYVGSRATSIYALGETPPKLLFSKEVPEGLHLEYRESRIKDLLLEEVSTNGMPVHDQMMKGRPGWIDQGNLEFLRRWGFGHCMAGAIKVNGKIAAVIYTGRSEIWGSYSMEARATMDLVCRASSCAYSAIDISPAANGLTISPHSTAAIDDTSELTNVAVLPPRGRQVAKLICEGRSNKDIARSLDISVYTVQDHLATLYKKFSVSNRTELVSVLMKNG